LAHFHTQRFEVRRVSDRVVRLVALRDLLAAALESADPEKLGPLAAQYRATLGELEALESKAEAGDPVDEIASRRSARRATAS
jgi:hypothetical protein